MSKGRSYIQSWIDKHYEDLATSEWYDENFNGEEREDIDPEFFIKTYLVPLIESNVSYDFGARIDAAKLTEHLTLKK